MSNTEPFLSPKKTGYKLLKNRVDRLLISSSTKYSKVKISVLAMCFQDAFDPPPLKLLGCHLDIFIPQLSDDGKI